MSIIKTLTGLDVFDKMIHTTNNWLKDLLFELTWEDRYRAYSVLRACLHALRDRLTLDKATNFSAQPPILIRSFYYGG
jgi:uncharacterized protein (DUF2267 family)